MSRRVLILFAHPALEKSRVNRQLAASVQDLEGVQLRDLYQLYPDLDIDVDDEQRQLAAHDVIVMQCPFFWYSTPALLKEWQDLVLTYGWAYGSDGVALHGKLFVTALTAGGRVESYSRGGQNHYTVRELLAPLERMAVLCGMRPLAPFVVHGTHALTEEAISQHAASYRTLIEALRDDALDLDRAAAAERLGDDLAALRRAPRGS